VWNHVEILKKLWVCAEEGQKNRNELKKKLLLAKDEAGLMAWQCAILLGNLEALEILLSWFMEVDLNSEELLLAKIEKGLTVFHFAAVWNHVEILNNLWVWAEKTQQNPIEFQKNFLLAKDTLGNIACHHAALNGRLEALETLFCFAIEAEINPAELLLAQGENGANVFHMAAKKNHAGILQKLWVLPELAHQNPNELKERLFLAKDNQGFTAGQLAARNGRLEALETILGFAFEVELNTDEL
jgi:ankyrin repeat protein